MLAEKDINILRELAHKYISYASNPEQDAKKELWLKLNSCNMHKPMVLISQIPWIEIKDENLVLKVTDTYWRNVENTIRRQLYQWEHMRVDMVLPQYICLPSPITKTEHFGIKFNLETRGSENAVLAQKYTDILNTEEDLNIIQPVNIALNQALKEEIECDAHKIFDGICEFRWQGIVMHLGLWDWISGAKSVTNCYYDLIDRPEFMHKIMQRLTDCVTDAIRQYNNLSAFDTACTLCHCSHTFTESLPSGTNGDISNNCWAFGLAQLFSSASPEITKEFEVPYMNKIFSHFGAIYYGCCERLDDRLEILDMMPNIKKVSCSPWSDREAFSEKLPKKYVMSNKPNPAFLATDSFDEQTIRDDIRRTINVAKANGTALELILKDISTINHDPSRLWKWAQIAEEETANF